jgi:hypothetical protein
MSIPTRIVYCCSRGDHFVLAYRLYEWKKAVVVDPPAIAAKLEDLADRGGVDLTLHQIAVDRALEAVTAVNTAIDMMASTGELQEFNRAFRAPARSIPASNISTTSKPAKQRCWRRWPGWRRDDKLVDPYLFGRSVSPATRKYSGPPSGPSRRTRHLVERKQATANRAKCSDLDRGINLSRGSTLCLR